MNIHALDTVVLTRDLPAHGLRAGDLGAVVEVLSQDALMVEFVTAGGQTQSVATLSAADVRPIDDSDVLAVRELDRTA